MENLYLELARNRQSCRDFNDKELSSQTVRKIAELATLSPSACNSQPWKMFLVTGEKVELVTKSLQNRGRNPFLDKAKAYIVITEKQAKLNEFVSSRFNRDHFVKYDIGQLTAYITLAAQSLEVSSCIIGWINQEELRSAVGYPENEESNIVVALGYSDIEVREKNRKDFDEVIEEIK